MARAIGSFGIGGNRGHLVVLRGIAQVGMTRGAEVPEPMKKAVRMDSA